MTDAESSQRTGQVWQILYRHVMTLSGLWVLGGIVLLFTGILTLEPAASDPTGGPIHQFSAGALTAIRMFGPMTSWLLLGVLLKTTIVAKHNGDSWQETAASLIEGEETHE